MAREALKRHDAGGIVRLSLDTGSGNPINPDLLEAFEDHLTELEVSPPRALILDGGEGKLFCGGFDVKAILSYSRAEMTRFFRLFNSTIARLTALPCPTIAEIRSHAIAGGFILPLACDFRVVDDGKFKLGLGEVDLGVPVPAGAQVLLAARTHPSVAARLAMFAAMLSPREAHEVGYANILAHTGVHGTAQDYAEQLAAKPGAGLRVTKQLMAESLVARVRRADERGEAAFLDTWFSPVAQSNLRALVESL